MHGRVYVTRPALVCLFVVFQCLVLPNNACLCGCVCVWQSWTGWARTHASSSSLPPLATPRQPRRDRDRDRSRDRDRTPLLTPSVIRPDPATPTNTITTTAAAAAAAAAVDDPTPDADWLAYPSDVRVAAQALTRAHPWLPLWLAAALVRQLGITTLLPIQAAAGPEVTRLLRDQDRGDDDTHHHHHPPHHHRRHQHASASTASGGSGDDADHHPHMAPDVLLHSDTGSGKTLAYLLPVLASLLTTPPAPAAERSGHVGPSAGQMACVIVAPSRELAVQIYHEAMALTSSSLPAHGPQANDEGEGGEGGGGGAPTWRSAHIRLLTQGETGSFAALAAVVWRGG